MHKRKYYNVSFITYMGYFFIGIISYLISPTLPVIIKDFNITKSIAGTVFTSNAAGNFVGVLAGGFLADMFGKKPLIATGCLLLVTGFLLTTITSSWVFILILFFAIGLGRGFLNTNFNALISDANVHRRGAAFNTLHGIYGMGCLIGPALAGLVLHFDFGWRPIYFASAILWILYLLTITPIVYPTNKKTEFVKTSNEKISLKTILLNPLFIMLFIVSFIYNGSATGLIGWISTYLDEMEYSTLISASAVSIFYLGLTSGRFLCRFASERIGYSKTILVCALGCLLFYPMAIFNTTALFMILGVLFSGFFLSGLHPTGLAYANTLFPTISGTITGLLSTALSLGTMILPWLIGLVAENKGFKAGFFNGWMLIIILVIVALFLLFYEKKTSKEAT